MSNLCYTRAEASVAGGGIDRATIQARKSKIKIKMKSKIRNRIKIRRKIKIRT